MNKKLARMLLGTIFISFLLINLRVFSEDDDNKYLKGVTTSTDMGIGIHVLTCDCTATKDFDCTCKVKDL